MTFQLMMVMMTRMMAAVMLACSTCSHSHCWHACPLAPVSMSHCVHRQSVQVQPKWAISSSDVSKRHRRWQVERLDSCWAAGNWPTRRGRSLAGRGKGRAAGPGRALGQRSLAPLALLAPRPETVLGVSSTAASVAVQPTLRHRPTRPLPPLFLSFSSLPPHRLFHLLLLRCHLPWASSPTPSQTPPLSLGFGHARPLAPTVDCSLQTPS